MGLSAVNALIEYKEDVKSGRFPESKTHTYKMADGEEERFKEWISKR